MKWNIPVIFFGTVILSGVLFATDNRYIRSEFLSSKRASEKWGNVSFDVKKWKAGDEKIRAAMAANLIEGKKIIGKSIALAQDELGHPDGYFFSELIPAYRIENRKAGERKDSWQVVLIAGKNGKTVEEIKIHKSCCYSEEEYGLKQKER